MFTITRTVSAVIRHVVWHAPGGPLVVGQIVHETGGWTVRSTYAAVYLSVENYKAMFEFSAPHVTLLQITERLTQ